MHAAEVSPVPSAIAHRGPIPSVVSNGVCGDCAIAKEADHRIANHLSLLAGLIRLKAADLAGQATEPTNEAVQILLENVRSQIEAVARLHRMFAVGGWRGSDLGEHLHGMCAPLISILSSRIVLIEDLSPGCQVQPDQILPLGQIVAEVITNAVKYAYPLGQAGKILVCSRRDGAETIVVGVVDNGPGLPDSFDTSTDGRLGFQLVRALSKQLGATIEFESEYPGLRFRLTLPLAVAQRSQRVSDALVMRLSVTAEAERNSVL
jgi:two-component sensor histidine kinase